MLVWEPPSRLVLRWQLSADWRCDPQVATEVEVRFSAEGPGTRVDLEHRGLEAYGDRAEEVPRRSGRPAGGPASWRLRRAGRGEEGVTPPRGRRVTLAHVAERAGVSRSAVSFVLSGRTDQRLSEETSARVRRAAEELGYRPNAAAQTLRTGRSGTVALVSDFVASTSHANSMVRGARRRCASRDRCCSRFDTQGDPAVEAQVLENLLSRSVDGVLYASMFTRVVDVPAALQRVPHVLLNCLPAGAVDGVRAVVPTRRPPAVRRVST